MVHSKIRIGKVSDVCVPHNTLQSKQVVGEFITQRFVYQHVKATPRPVPNSPLFIVPER